MAAGGGEVTPPAPRSGPHPGLRNEPCRAAIASTNLLAKLEQRYLEECDKMILDAVMDEMVDMDTDKVTESVSWAKFGPESLRAFSWNLVKEEVRQPQTQPQPDTTSLTPPLPTQIARGEGVEARDVEKLLREVCGV